MSGIVVAGFLYGYSAFVLHDVMSLVVLPLIWVALFVLGCRWFMTRPYRVLVLSAAALAVWFVAMLGWVA
ncbi:MAG TPA: hypothetical protein VFG63_14730 [Nocardioidaceae bacterium]|nr:hypothetical protein [Nocardioidaceae bacterium]